MSSPTLGVTEFRHYNNSDDQEKLVADTEVFNALNTKNIIKLATATTAREMIQNTAEDMKVTNLLRKTKEKYNLRNNSQRTSSYSRNK